MVATSWPAAGSFTIDAPGQVERVVGLRVRAVGRVELVAGRVGDVAERVPRAALHHLRHDRRLHARPGDLPDDLGRPGRLPADEVVRRVVDVGDHRAALAVRRDLHEVAERPVAAGRAPEPVRADLAVLHRVLGRRDDVVCRAWPRPRSGSGRTARSTRRSAGCRRRTRCTCRSRSGTSLLAGLVRVVPGEVDPPVDAGHDPGERVRALGGDLDGRVPSGRRRPTRRRRAARAPSARRRWGRSSRG